MEKGWVKRPTPLRPCSWSDKAHQDDSSSPWPCKHEHEAGMQVTDTLDNACQTQRNGRVEDEHKPVTGDAHPRSAVHNAHPRPARRHSGESSRVHKNVACRSSDIGHGVTQRPAFGPAYEHPTDAQKRVTENKHDLHAKFKAHATNGVIGRAHVQSQNANPPQVCDMPLSAWRCDCHGAVFAHSPHGGDPSPYQGGRRRGADRQGQGTMHTWGQT